MTLDSKTILDYVLKNFLLKYDAEDFMPEIGYESAGTKRIVINSSGFSYFKNNVTGFPESIYHKEYSGREIPFLFGDAAKEIIEITGNGLLIHADIIASAFYFLSGWQERNAETHDEFGRFRYADSIQLKLNITGLPVVNYYFLILKEAIEKAFNVKIKTRKQEQFSCFISHDIDDWNTLWKQEAFHALKELNPFGVAEYLLYKLTGRDIQKTFDKLTNIEEKHNVKSTFFFLAKHGLQLKNRNADYHINEERFRKAINMLSAEGNEIGVHGSFFTHDSSTSLSSDRQKIEAITKSNVSGNRFHFLCFDINKTLQVLEQSGFRYDSTLGFAEEIGFRNSYADPFYLFSYEKMAASSVIEFPHIIMDATFYFTKYLNVGREAALKKIYAMIEEVSKVNGCLIFNWHNTSYMKYKRKGWDKVIDEVIGACLAKGAKFYTFSDYFKKHIQPH